MAKITQAMLKAAQKKGLKILADLQSKGYVISQYTIDMIEKPLGSKTQKEASIYLQRMTSRYIKSRAVNKPSRKKTGDIYVNPNYIKKKPITDPSYRQRASQLTGNKPFSVRKDKYGFAEDVYNMILSGAQSYGHSTDVSNRIRFIYSKLGIEQPEHATLAEDVLNLESILKSKLRKIDREDFIKSMAFQQYLAEGVFDPKRVAERKELSTLSSKQGFIRNYSLFNADRVETIYDFFQSSQVWQQIRKQYKPSDDADIDDFLDRVASSLDSGDLTVRDIDRALLNYSQSKSLTRVLDEAIATAKARN